MAELGIDPRNAVRVGNALTLGLEFELAVPKDALSYRLTSLDSGVVLIPLRNPHLPHTTESLFLDQSDHRRLEDDLLGFALSHGVH